ncbi:MAG TPA: polysaccharide deacetylase family protein [Thermoplasmata archaeon]|nr:polysaccharide deacetylase family protein [Thermoplasmata archaeon]
MTDVEALRPALDFLIVTLGLPEVGPQTLPVRVEDDRNLVPLAREIGANLERVYALSPRDEHGRLRPTGLLHEPVVDRLAQAFLRALREYARTEGVALLRKWPWRHARPFAIALSHDVDFPRKWRAKSVASDALKRRDLRGMSGRLRGAEDPWWTYDTIRAIEARAKIGSTFFFAAGGKHPEDPKYQIENPQMRALVRELGTTGGEIGLHGSYRASEDAQLLLKEKRRFERHTGIAVDTHRQHYLRFHPESPRRLKEAGFRYDSSLGTEFSLGFLDGVSVPHSLGDVLELPVSAMDTCFQEASDVNRAYRTDASRRDALQQVLSNVREVHGLLVVDWHQNYFDDEDFPGFRRLYEGILDTSADGDRGGVRDIAQWWEGRAASRFRGAAEGWRLEGDRLPSGFTTAVSHSDLESDDPHVVTNTDEETLYTFTTQGPWGFRLS